MTIIAALVQDRKIYYGYNDGAELGGTPIFAVDCPWLSFGQWLIGLTGASVVQRILSHHKKELSVDCESPISFCSLVAEILDENSVGTNIEGDFGLNYGVWGILINNNGLMWDLSSCLTPTTIPEGFIWARGSGSDYALGAGFSIEKIAPKMNAELKLKICIESSIKNDIYSIGNAIICNKEILF
jgi:hypothetical protein